MNRQTATKLFIESTQDMHSAGTPLMHRVLGAGDGNADSWAHYPPDDVVNGPLHARWFYHCHPPEERDAGEHGHFHLFVGKNAVAKNAVPLMSAPSTEMPRADVVHLAALSIDTSGLPRGWFTINRWVTDEWLYPADALLPLLPSIDFRGAAGDGLVNAWLTGMFALERNRIAKILLERDMRIAEHAIGAEDRDTEVISSVPLSLESLLD